MKRLRLLAGIVAVIAVLAVAAILYATSVPGTSFAGKLPPLTELETALAARLRAHIAAIASKPHNVTHYDDLEQAALYIEKELAALGYAINRQTFPDEGRVFRNIEVVIEPADPMRMRGSIVVGAHYDSCETAPGANDNGSGSAAIIELARTLSDLREKTDARIRLVLFVNEEPPYFQEPGMGSRHYARYLMQKREPMIGMLSLETMGYFKDEPNTQRYPPPFSWIYPSEGNFIAFVGMLGSRDLVRAVIGSFRDHTSFPSVGGVAPGFITGIDWSDHTSFADFGVPALMVTDTATFRYPYYHTPEDTLDKVDTEKLARVTMGIDRVIRDMASPRWSTKSFASRD